MGIVCASLSVLADVTGRCGGTEVVSAAAAAAAAVKLASFIVIASLRTSHGIAVGE